MAMERSRIATQVDWLFAPDWLTVDEACFLSGWDRAAMHEIIDVGGVDLNDGGQIDKVTLWEFQETLSEVLHWDE